jgi:hypothetical protein
MTLPFLDERGVLPAGVHEATWTEIEALFLFNVHRERLYARVRTFTDQVLLPVLGDCALDLIAGGSFLSDKPAPADIEITVYLPVSALAHPSMPALLALGTQEAHGRLKAAYGADFYLTPRLHGHNDFGLLFQYVGPKTAADKGLHEKDHRGVVKVMRWQHG